MVISKPGVWFNNESYQLVFTFHARRQMRLRGLSESVVMNIIETGKIKKKRWLGKYWVYRATESRPDQVISVALSAEYPYLIVITTLVDWSPR